MKPPFHYLNFDSLKIGIDEKKGRFGEVTIHVCKRCQWKWLRYFVEYESFSGSGRWYRRLVSDEVASIEILKNLDWHFYGGSYFGTAGQKGSGPIFVDL